MMLLDPPRLHHRFRWATQFAAKPRIAIAGGYHFGNLGDMALGECVARIAERPKRDLQTIYNLDKWPRADYTIVGGGAVIHKLTLDHLIERHRDSPERLAIVGVDIEDFDAVAERLDFLNAIASFSVRSVHQRDRLREIGSTNVQAQPDICFSLLGAAPQPARKAGRMGFNVSPRFFQKHMESAETREKYRALLRELLAYAKARGLELHHFAFTSGDDACARSVFTDAEVSFHKYSPSVERMLSNIAACDLFFASRFHSIIFCLVAGTPAIPFLYADKSYRLLHDIGLADQEMRGYKELRQLPAERAIEWLNSFEPLSADADALRELDAEVRRHVGDAVAAIGCAAPA